MPAHRMAVAPTEKSDALAQYRHFGITASERGAELR